MSEKFKVISPKSILSDEMSAIQSNTMPENFTTGATALKNPPVRSMAQKHADNLVRGKEIIDKYITNNEEYNKVVANYEVLTNTEIKNLTDVTALDLTSQLDVTTVDFAAKGLPNPADYNLDPAAVVDLTAIDATDWDLPKPELVSINPDCYDGMGTGLSSFLDLDGINMSDFDLPTFDFSFATDFDFPDWMDPSNIDLGSMFDLSSVDLSGVIDLVNIDLPDFDFPEFSNPFDGIELPSMSGLVDDVKGLFDDMGGDGDLFGLGAVGNALGAVGCVGVAIVDTLLPDAVITAVKNFEMPDLDMDGLGDIGEYVGDLVDLDGMRDFLGDSDLDELKTTVDDIFGEGTSDDLLDNLGVSDDRKPPILTAITFLGDDWMWDDKERRIYSHDALVSVSPLLLSILSTRDSSKRAAEIASALQTHRKTVGVNYDGRY